MTAARITVTIAEQLARDARRALRELLDRWWAEDPDGAPTDEERAAARVQLGLQA